MEKPDPQAIAEAANVTPAYARMILAGTRRPSIAVALRILDRTGWRHDSIADLSADELALLAKLDRAA